ncbi:MAG TPA: sensor histidine kinase [Verrucomicrobiales bacterium]|nr:sensor histidine kinase [Verrucomicrobiales bacterium]
MPFPPPIRLTAPLVAFVCGLTATLLDYRLNLDLDLARHQQEQQELADSNGRRLAKLAGNLTEAQSDVLQTDVEGTEEVPNLELAGVLDDTGRILAGSPKTLRGEPAANTRLAGAAKLIGQGQPSIIQGESELITQSAHPFSMKGGKTGWVLLEFNRAPAVAAAYEDARIELKWMALAMGILSLALWALLHFAFAARLARLARGVRSFGEGTPSSTEMPRGGDEVGQLAQAFSVMSRTLREREAEQWKLEREVLDISERERRRFGRDLHDGLGQRLTAASMSTNALVAALQKENPDFAARAEEVGLQLRSAIAETRMLSHGLAPVSMEDDGLMSALAALANGVSQAGVRCVFDCPAPVRVKDAEVAGQLYRIAQEAVNNALKHASPAEIRIGLGSSEGSVVLEVDDDGGGIPAEPTGSKGIGLRVMRYRARTIGARLETGSPPAGGTRISCTIPGTV